MRLSNATIRRRMLKYAKRFIVQNCQYDDGHEKEAVVNMLKMVWPVDPACEKYNKKVPTHGLQILT